MHTLDAPKFFNDLIFKIQSFATALGIKVLVDISAKAWFRLDGLTFEKHLFDLMTAMIQAAPQGSILSFVTHFEAEKAQLTPGTTADEGEEQGQLSLSIITPVAPHFEYLLAVNPLSTFLKSQGGEICLHATKSKVRLTISLPHSVRPLVPRSSPVLRYKVLLVEDEPEMQEIITSILEQEQFEVVTASDGFSALLHLERHAPDVILTDIVLPNLNGIDLISRISAAKPNLPIIVFTGFPETLVHLPEGTRCKVLQKPVYARELLAALGSILHQDPPRS